MVPFARVLGMALLAGCVPADAPPTRTPATPSSNAQPSARTAAPADAARAAAMPTDRGATAPAAGQVQTWQLTPGLDCAPSLGLHACLRRHEPAVLARLGIAGRRVDTELCLPLAPAPTCLRDREGLRYTLIDGMAGQLLVVEAEDTGGYTVLLLDRSGGGTRRIDNRPLYSADGSRFATVSYDTDAGYVPNRVVVWGAAAAAPAYTVEGFAPGTGPVAIRWVGPARLEVLYSRTPYAPDARDAGTFDVWQDTQGAWHDDYDQ